jgi:hypothetical protein
MYFTPGSFELLIISSMTNLTGKADIRYRQWVPPGDKVFAPSLRYLKHSMFDLGAGKV